MTTRRTVPCPHCDSGDVAFDLSIEIYADPYGTYSAPHVEYVDNSCGCEISKDDVEALEERALEDPEPEWEHPDNV